MGPARVAVLALQLLQDQARRLGPTNLLHDTSRSASRRSRAWRRASRGRRSSAPCCRRSCSRAARPSAFTKRRWLRRSLARGPFSSAARPCAEYRERFLRFQRNRGASALRSPGAARRSRMPGTAGRVAGGYSTASPSPTPRAGRASGRARSSISTSTVAPRPGSAAHLDSAPDRRPLRGRPPGVLHFDTSSRTARPSLEASESWADVHLNRADLRLGIQKFAWGSSTASRRPTSSVARLPRSLVRTSRSGRSHPGNRRPYYLPTCRASTSPSCARPSSTWPLACRRASRCARSAGSRPAPCAEPCWSCAGGRLARRRHAAAGDLVIRSSRDARSPPASPLHAGDIAVRPGRHVAEERLDLYHYTVPRRHLTPTCAPRCVLVSTSRRSGLRACSLPPQAHDVIHSTGRRLSSVLGGFTGATGWRTSTTAPISAARAISSEATSARDGRAHTHCG